jgi:hypothetical protein
LGFLPFFFLFFSLFSFLLGHSYPSSHSPFNSFFF